MNPPRPTFRDAAIGALKLCYLLPLCAWYRIRYEIAAIRMGLLLRENWRAAGRVMGERATQAKAERLDRLLNPSRYLGK